MVKLNLDKIKNSPGTSVFIGLCIGVFLIMTPRMAQFWYMRGTGNAYKELIFQGFSNSPTVLSEAKNNGFIYSTLMVIGINFSILCLLFTAALYFSKDIQNKFKSKLKVLYLGIILISCFSLAYAESMVSNSYSFYYLIIPSLLFSLIFSLLTALPIIVINFFNKKRMDN